MTVDTAGSRRWTSGGGLALAAFSAVVFGFGTTFARLAYDGGANPLTAVLLRTTVFVVVIWVLLIALGRARRLARRPLVATIWMAGTLAMVSIGYQGSVAYIPVSLAALVFYSFPLMVGIMAVAARRDRMTARKALALLIAFVGLALVLGPGFEALDWRGIALAVVASLGMATTLTFGGGATRGQDALLMSAYTNLWMVIGLAVFVAATGSLALPTTLPGAVATAALCLSYVVAYVCWYQSLSRVRPVLFATLLNIEPLVTLVAAWLILGEMLSGLQLVGAGLVIASIASVTASGASEARSGDRPGGAS